MDIALDSVRLPVSESDTKGQVVVITDIGGGGTLAAVVLIVALRLKMETANGLIRILAIEPSCASSHCFNNTVPSELSSIRQLFFVIARFDIIHQT